MARAAAAQGRARPSASAEWQQGQLVSFFLPFRSPSRCSGWKSSSVPARGGSGRIKDTNPAQGRAALQSISIGTCDQLSVTGGSPQTHSPPSQLVAGVGFAPKRHDDTGVEPPRSAADPPTPGDFLIPWVCSARFQPPRVSRDNVLVCLELGFQRIPKQNNAPKGLPSPCALGWRWAGAGSPRGPAGGSLWGWAAPGFLTYGENTRERVLGYMDPSQLPLPCFLIPFPRLGENSTGLVEECRRSVGHIPGCWERAAEAP